MRWLRKNLLNNSSMYCVQHEMNSSAKSGVGTPAYMVRLFLHLPTTFDLVLTQSPCGGRRCAVHQLTLNYTEDDQCRLLSIGKFCVFTSSDLKVIAKHCWVGNTGADRSWLDILRRSHVRSTMCPNCRHQKSFLPMNSTMGKRQTSGPVASFSTLFYLVDTLSMHESPDLQGRLWQPATIFLLWALVYLSSLESLATSLILCVSGCC